jgi:hypothetical protein
MQHDVFYSSVSQCRGVESYSCTVCQTRNGNHTVQTSLLADDSNKVSAHVAGSARVLTTPLDYIARQISGEGIVYH